MTKKREWKPGDEVWVPGNVMKNWRGEIVVSTGNSWTFSHTWRPRADGFAPEQGSDVTRLREAATFAVDAMMHPECYTSQAIKDAAACLQDALAAVPKPIEGPVREGDYVRFEGYVTKAFGCNVYVKVLDEEYGLPRKAVTIVSRPAPAGTCGRCRWFRAEAWVDKCRHDLGLDTPAADTPACSHFELWEPRQA